MVSLRKPFGADVPLPETKAKPSCSANTVCTSSASQRSMSTALSSSRVGVAAGIA